MVNSKDSAGEDGNASCSIGDGGPLRQRHSLVLFCVNELVDAFLSGLDSLQGLLESGAYDGSEPRGGGILSATSANLASPCLTKLLVEPVHMEAR